MRWLATLVLSLASITCGPGTVGSTADASTAGTTADDETTASSTTDTTDVEEFLSCEPGVCLGESGDAFALCILDHAASGMPGAVSFEQCELEGPHGTIYLLFHGDGTVTKVADIIDYDRRDVTIQRSMIDLELVAENKQWCMEHGCAACRMTLFGAYLDDQLACSR